MNVYQFDPDSIDAGTAVTVNQICPRCEQTISLIVDAKKFEQWRNGEYIQNVWSHVSAAHREILQTGLHPACFDAIFDSDETES